MGCGGNPTTYASASLSYDPENRLTAVGSTLSATYRADGLRASKATSVGTTYFLYDEGNPIVELNSSGTVTAFNIFSPDGLVARTASSTTTEYVFDQQGNVVNRTNTSGANVSVTQYDAYGTEHAAYGSPSDPFAYNGQWGYYLDRETGLYCCQHRYYDPGIGRWLNRDPIGFGGGTNLYKYCADGPVSSADPSGDSLVPIVALLNSESSNWTEDPFGAEVIKGGPLNLLNPNGNIITVGRIRFSPNARTTADYLDPKRSWWPRHEYNHQRDQEQYGIWFWLTYPSAACFGYWYEVTHDVPRSRGGPTGHDYNFSERRSINAHGNVPYRDPREAVDSYFDDLLQRVGNAILYLLPARAAAPPSERRHVGRHLTSRASGNGSRARLSESSGFSAGSQGN